MPQAAQTLGLLCITITKEFIFLVIRSGRKRKMVTCDCAVNYLRGALVLTSPLAIIKNLQIKRVASLTM